MMVMVRGRVIAKQDMDPTYVSFKPKEVWRDKKCMPSSISYCSTNATPYLSCSIFKLHLHVTDHTFHLSHQSD
jgi:hypothetical protein